MLALWIILGVLAFIFLLLLVPFRFSFHYGAEITLKLRVLFLKFTLFPAEEKPPKETGKKEAQPQQTGGRLKSLKDKHGLTGLLEIFAEAAKILGSSLVGTIRHIRVKELDVYAVAGGENAADVAVLYGRACGVIYPAVNIIKGACRCKKVGVTVDADYKAKESSAICSAEFSLQPLFAVGQALRALFRLVPILLKLRA